jgi:hypothetical protein
MKNSKPTTNHRFFLAGWTSHTNIVSVGKPEGYISYSQAKRVASRKGDEFLAISIETRDSSGEVVLAELLHSQQK